MIDRRTPLRPLLASRPTPGLSAQPLAGPASLPDESHAREPLLARPAPSRGGPVLPQIDALRGVAILAVFVQHLGDSFRPFVEARIEARVPATLVPWILTILHHAFWGVDLFFVLSGFSLSLGLIRSFSPDHGGEQGRLDVRSFYLRRAARILPAFFAAVAVMIAVHRSVIERPGFALALAAHLALLQGYVLPGGIVFIGAAWSLTTEAHFYLLLPLLARPLLAREGRAPFRRLLVGFAICLLSWGSRALLHAWVLSPGVHTAILEATQRRWISSRLDQFVLGSLAAVAYTEITRERRTLLAASRAAPLALYLSVAALPVAFKLEGASYLSPGGSYPYALISLATAALVLSASLCEGRARRLVAPAPLRALGVISYGVFLYHQLAIGLVGSWRGRLGSASWGSLAWNGALSLALSSAMGLASWVAIERPALRAASARLALSARPPSGR